MEITHVSMHMLNKLTSSSWWGTVSLGNMKRTCLGALHRRKKKLIAPSHPFGWIHPQRFFLKILGGLVWVLVWVCLFLSSFSFLSIELQIIPCTHSHFYKTSIFTYFTCEVSCPSHLLFYYKDIVKSVTINESVVHGLEVRNFIIAV